MRTIAIANQKGGCGKTTVAINLSACLAREGQRVLLVDLDPQGHCALGLAVPEEQIEFSVLDVLLGAEGTNPVELSRIIWQISANFDLAPSRTDLARFELQDSGNGHGLATKENCLSSVLRPVSDRYDFAVVDCPPHVGMLTRNALQASGEIIIPVDTGYFSLHGLSKQLETLQELQKTYGRDFVTYILPNLYDVRTKLAREILAEIRKKFDSLTLACFINFNTKLKEGASFGQPITEYDASSMGCRDFVRLARELIAKGGVEEGPMTLLQQADNIAESADRLLATTTTLLGNMKNKSAAQSAPSTGHADADAGAKRASGDSQESPAPSPTPMSPAAADPGSSSPVSVGLGLAEPAAIQPAEPTVSHQQIEEKIQKAYGAQVIDNTVLFLTNAPGARSVQVAGDFNNWSPEANCMRPINDQGDFETRIPLSPGRYRYRLVVDGRWKSDPFNQAAESNPFGDLNSVIEVG